MIRFYFFLVALIFSLNAQSQLFNKGWVFTGGGTQNVNRLFIDNANNKYLVVGYDTVFYADSFGKPIRIQPHVGNSFNNGRTPSQAIVKLDPKGNYLNHIVFGTYFNTTISNIVFDQNNNPFVVCSHLNSSFYLENKKGQLMSRLNQNAKFVGSGFSNSSSYLMVVKFNPQLDYQWIRRFQRESWAKSVINTRSFRPNLVEYNNNNELEISFQLDRPYNYPPSHLDTLKITDTSTQITYSSFSTNADLIRVVLDNDGNFVSNHDLIKQPKNTIDFDSMQVSINIQAHKANQRVVFKSINTRQPDTLFYKDTVVLGVGINLVLFNLDENDSVRWAKKINHYYADNEHTQNPNYLGVLVDTTHKKIILILRNAPTQTFFYYNNPQVFGTVFHVFNYDGTLDKTLFYKNATQTWLTQTPYNHRYLFGTSVLTSDPDPKLAPYIKNVRGTQNALMAATLDSNFNIIQGQALLDTVSRLQTAYLGFTTSNIFDSRGVAYLPGSFTKKIKLPCKSLHANLTVDDKTGLPFYDGFIISIDPKEMLDTQACKTYLSPSSKYLWDSTGRYYDTLISSQGCDSVAIVNLEILEDSVVLDTAVCYHFKSPDGLVTWDSSGNYIDTLTNSFGCDSVIFIRLSVLNNYDTLDTTACLTYKSPSGKYIWDNSGRYSDTLLNTKGCDSILLINLTLLATDTVIDTAVCSQYTAPSGQFVWDSSGTYADTLLNHLGCDSLITIRLKILENITKIDTAVCDSFFAPSGKYFWTLAGAYSDTLPNTFGCDSILIFNLKLLNTDTFMDVKACQYYTSPSGKYSWDSTGVFQDTLINSVGCDSIMEINLIIIDRTYVLDTTTCDQLISPSGKYTWTTEGTYFDTLVNPTGCDSIIQINLSLSNSDLEIVKSNNINCDSSECTLSVSGGSNYQWSSSVSWVSNDKDVVNVSPFVNTWYTVYGLDSNQCKMVDSIQVKVDKDPKLEAPANVFTPNNDGFNDCFILTNSFVFDQVNWTIYNRWGNVVFNTNDPRSCWNGQWENVGLIAPDGVYFYNFKGTYCDREFEFSGTVHLIRP